VEVWIGFINSYIGRIKEEKVWEEPHLPGQPIFIVIWLIFLNKTWGINPLRMGGIPWKKGFQFFKIRVGNFCPLFIWPPF